MNTVRVPARERLLGTLETGANLTSKQIRNRFRVANPYDLVYRLRNDGYRIDLEERVNSKGSTKNFYSLVKAKTLKKK